MTETTVRNDSKREHPRLIPVLFGLLVSILSAIGAVAIWRARHEGAFTFLIAGTGLSQGPLLVLLGVLNRRWKSLARKLVLLAGGATALIFSLWASVDFHLEGFFLLLLSGAMGAAVGHVLITVILGPFLFGRLVCGWGCWNAMVLDLLPFRKSQGRVGWGRLPYFTLLASFLFVALARFGFGHRASGLADASEFLWAFGGFVFYYVLAIGTAFVFKDNRAFCKYVCPASAILRQNSRFALLKIAGDPGRCNECGLCVRACPMDLRIPEYVRSGSRVTSGECIQCRSCVNVCPSGALKWSMGLDGGRESLLVVRKTEN